MRARPRASMLPRRVRHACSLRPRSCFGQQSKEGRGLGRPPSTHFTNENHKLGSAARTHESRVREFLPPPRRQATLHRHWPRDIWRTPHNKVETKVVSTANCAPPNIGRPPDHLARQARHPGGSALERAKPRLPNTPALAHAARTRGKGHPR